ncbi:unnamed protein product [Phaedon cochleariae]|uniref:Uncharacterized protein n=1 Tax=Phaedon cochleariae TaxID=80249 RepID=A0A9P0GQZ1_PHACE|nr:unnamed protein product [Phaedon cochleariae]
MNSLPIVTFFAALAVTNAGVLAPSASIIQGPSSRTIVAGPDGSVISSVAPGGQIISEASPTVVAGAAPILASPVVSTYSSPALSAYSSPVLSAYSAPVLSAYSAPVLSAYTAPVVSAYAAPAVYASGLAGHSSEDTVVAGPSGTIATSRKVATPAVYGHGIHGLYF